MDHRLNAIQPVARSLIDDMRMRKLYDKGRQHTIFAAVRQVCRLLRRPTDTEQRRRI